MSGRVQGVGYRASCARQADLLGLFGHARNLDDGRVEVVASGPAEAVEALVDWCRAGPRGAEVTELTELPGGTPPAGGGPRFSVR